MHDALPCVKEAIVVIQMDGGEAGRTRTRSGQRRDGIRPVERNKDGVEPGR